MFSVIHYYWNNALSDTSTWCQSTERQQQYYNRNAQNYTSDYKPGEQVHVQLAPKSKWKLGNVIRKDENPRSYHVKVDGATYRRNQRFIKRDESREFRNGSNLRNQTRTSGLSGSGLSGDTRSQSQCNYTPSKSRTDVNPRSPHGIPMTTRQSSGRCIKAPNRLNL